MFGRLVVLVAALLVVVSTAAVDTDRSVPQPGIFAVTFGAVTAQASEVPRDCTSCDGWYFVQNPPAEAGGRQYAWYFGDEQCEDGYSASGPCSYCDLDGCLTLTVWAWNTEIDYCDEELCDPQRSELHVVADEAIDAASITALAEVMASHPKAFALKEGTPQLAFLDCSGNAVSSRSLPTGWVAQLRQVLPDRRNHVGSKTDARQSIPRP
jgi:hypothetical protein